MQNSIYKKYLGWSFVSSIAVSIESVLCTHSMFGSMSGIEASSIQTVNYVGKDVIGQLGCLWYMSRMGKESDKNTRNFMNKMHFAQQFGYLSTCITPFFPSYYMPIAGASNILFNVSFAGYGAVNAKCIEKLATDGNIGELYANIAMINTLGSSIGLLIGMGITVAIPDHTAQLCMIPPLAAMRIYTTNKSIQLLLK